MILRRLQTLTFGQWVLAYLAITVFSGFLTLLTRHWDWPLMGLPVDFWRGFLQASATILPSVIVGASVCAGAIPSAKKPEA